MTTPSAADIDRQLVAGVRHVSYLFHRRTKRNVILQDITEAVLSASHDLDNGRSSLRTCKMVINPALLDPPFDISGEYVSFTEVERVLNQDVEYPIGLFHMSDPVEDFTSGTKRWTVDGVDLKADLIQAEAPNTYVVPAGRNYMDEVRFILDFLDYPHSLPGTDLVAPTDLAPWPPFTPYATIIDGLLDGINHYPIYALGTGAFTTQERIPYGNRSPDVVYDTESDSLVRSGFKRRRDLTRFPNRVSVSVQDPFRPFQFVNRQNNDSDSPNSVSRRGATDTYPLNGDRVADAFLGKFEDPTNALEGAALSVAFNPAGTYLAVGLSVSPYIAVYAFSQATGIGTRVSAPASLPTGPVRGVAWNQNGTALACAHDNSPYLTAYPFSGGAFGTKYADPATPPAAHGNSVAFTAAGDYLGVAHQGSPYVSVYPFSVAAGIGAKVADPAAIPTGIGTGIMWSPDDAYLAVSHYDGLSVWAWAAGFGAAETIPALPSEAYDVAWSPDGSQLAVPLDEPPYVRAWEWNAGIVQQLPNPSQQPISAAFAVRYRPQSDHLAVGGRVPYPSTAWFKDGTNLQISAINQTAGEEGMAVYPVAEEFDRIIKFPTLILAVVQGVAWHPSGLIMAIAHTQTPYLSVVQFQGGYVYDDIADYYLSLFDTRSDLGTLQTHFDPRRGAHEVYMLNIESTQGEPIEANSLWRVASWSANCANGAPMVHQLGRARSLDFEDFT